MDLFAGCPQSERYRTEAARHIPTCEWLVTARPRQCETIFAYTPTFRPLMRLSERGTLVALAADIGPGTTKRGGRRQPSPPLGQDFQPPMLRDPCGSIARSRCDPDPREEHLSRAPAE